MLLFFVFVWIYANLRGHHDTAVALGVAGMRGQNLFRTIIVSVILCCCHALCVTRLHGVSEALQFRPAGL